MSNARDDAIAASIRQAKEQKDFLGTVRIKSELSEAKAQIAALEAELQLSNDRLGVALALDAVPRSMPNLDPPKGPGGRGAFVLAFSDIHAAERVDKEQVGGRNEYSPSICQKRVNKLIDQARWMIEAWRAGPNGYGWKIDQIILWLGGDIMTGFIHDDLVESNFMSPTEEVMFAQDLCVQVIDALSAHDGIKRVEVPTSWGNHGRDTPDRRVATGWKRSYEWMMYRQIAKLYASNPNVRVHVGQDEITRLDVLGTKIRFTHGDQIKYGDGVGGLTIPLRKWLAKQDRTERADLTIIGHHHQYLDLGDAVVNGSLIGWGAYAQRVAPYSPASQVCCLIDEKYGKRMSTELIVQ